MMAGRGTSLQDAAGGPARHIPVLLTEVVDILQPRDGGIYIDGTFGAGGYSRALIEAADCRVLGIDRDPTALAGGWQAVANSGGRLKLAAGRFSRLDEIATEAGLAPADGVTLDVGVSSMQIDDAERGFSFMRDGPLDMRMGDSGPTAADVVNRLPEADLARVIYFLGEERRSRAVARAVVAARKAGPISMTGQLAEIVGRTVGRARDGIHPATRTFQALRIYVNSELDELAAGLGAAERVLKPGGRLAVVSFHSLEDRIVKRFVQERGRVAGTSRHMPAPEQASPTFRILTRGAVEAGEAEVARNARARSAKLRCVERSEEPARDVDPVSLGVPQLPDLETVYRSIQ